MKAVFLGGSRRISRLNEAIRSKLDDLAGRGFSIFVGDANGADRAIQQHFASRKYPHVVVYAVRGKLRNNVGRWEVRLVDPPKGARGFELYAAKDAQMANDASYGLMLWDGESRVTIANVRRLLAQEKPVAVYFAPSRRFVSLRSSDELGALGLGSVLPASEQPGLPFGEAAGTARGAAAGGGEHAFGGAPRQTRGGAGTRNRS